MGSIGSGVGTFWPAEVLSGAEIEEDRDIDFEIENQPEPPPIRADVTTAERSHSVTGTVEASEIAGLVGVEVPTSEVGSQRAIREAPILKQEAIPDLDGLDWTSCQKIRKCVKRNKAHKVAQPDQHRKMNDGAGDGCGKAVISKFLLEFGSAIARVARFS
uniref:Uncharacterized protein n=1 Tax=Peronospora matthiolae TaxID=2874970 RepID=A0AAV1UXJ0_9STRA